MSRSFFQGKPPSTNTETLGGLQEKIRNPGQIRSMKGAKPDTPRQAGEFLLLPSGHQFDFVRPWKKRNPTSWLLKQMAKPSLRSLRLSATFSLLSSKRKQADAFKTVIQKNVKGLRLVLSFLEILWNIRLGPLSCAVVGSSGRKNSDCFWNFACWVPDHLPTPE